MDFRPKHGEDVVSFVQALPTTKGVGNPTDEDRTITSSQWQKKEIKIDAARLANNTNTFSRSWQWEIESLRFYVIKQSFNCIFLSSKALNFILLSNIANLLFPIWKINCIFLSSKA